jgi:hypothetical protein
VERKRNCGKKRREEGRNNLRRSKGNIWVEFWVDG